MYPSHLQSSLLQPQNKRYREALVRYTLEEMEGDIGNGDRTSELVFSGARKITATIFAKEKGVIAGIQEIQFFLTLIKGVTAEFYKKDGQQVKRGDEIIKLSGDRKILMEIERIILNILGRMSGIATLTNRLVAKVHRISSRILLTPTRKTVLGWLDKRACVVGGGGTHRLSLDTGVLIKHNHLKASGLSLSALLREVIAHAKREEFIEVEVSTAQNALVAAKLFSQAINHGFKIPCFIMFDNMSPQEIKKNLSLLKKEKVTQKLFFEASGNITPKNLGSYAKTGVNIISMGALTHSARSLDLSMRITSR